MAGSREHAASGPPSRGERVATALDRRLPLTRAGRRFLRKAFPDHWSFLLGEVALYSLILLVLTGVFLSFFFHPDMTERPYTGSYVRLRLILPGLLLALAGVHVALVVHHKHTQWVKPGRTNRNVIVKPLVPQYTAKSLGLLFSLTGVLVLMSAPGGQDVLSYVFHTPLELMTYTLRAGVFVVPFVVHHATKRACLGLQAADRRRLIEGQVTPDVERTAEGGYVEARTPLSAEEGYRILVRDEPRPRLHGTEAWRLWHRHRIRNALSRWYFAERVELPTTDHQRRHIEIARAGPGEAAGDGGTDGGGGG
ncbi:cytochrome b N-terminal domain-containing protein [Streptomyces sp. NPDC004065]|uniref:cytochrome b N-terminal domain-containing protein n=1 Tax=Streptomyces sp. NPDC004065 TaxID=3364689 RepID=UPI00384ADAAB